VNVTRTDIESIAEAWNGLRSTCEWVRHVAEKMKGDAQFAKMQKALEVGIDQMDRAMAKV